MNIVHISTELAPVAKVGGLGDVVFGLSRELIRCGHDVHVILPKYACTELEGIQDLEIEIEPIRTEYKGNTLSSTVWRGRVKEIQVHLIEPHSEVAYFERDEVYGYEDDVERFCVFSKVALDYLVAGGYQPEILHLHDWQTGPAAVLFRKQYRERCFPHCQLIYTIHNLGYQGQAFPEDLDALGLEGKAFLSQEQMGDDQDWGRINLMKAGVVYADAVNTVSPSYAKEILTPEGGKGLQGTLWTHRSKLFGVLNGIDYDYWNPESDPYLPAHYNAAGKRKAKVRAPSLGIQNKDVVKQALRKYTGLEERDRPIVICISRLVPQKGLDLIRHALFRTLEKDGQFLLLGSSPCSETQAQFVALQERFAHHPHARLFLQHEERLAHLMFSGADIIVVPSLYEPCGLTQLIAMRYGTVPVVRETGGLADTVFDVDHSGRCFGEVNGFGFKHPDEGGVNYALDRALDLWKRQPRVWGDLVKNCLNVDSSWTRSAQDYLGIYEEVKVCVGVKS